MSDTVTTMTVHPPVDYAHLPGEEQNPLMESSLHAQWVVTLISAVGATLADTDHLVTGNVPFDPGDGGPHLAPDLMVIPHAAGQQYTLYRVDDDHPLPTVCIEVISRSNTRKQLDRRARRMLEAGVSELYELHPHKQTIECIELVDGELRHRNAVGARSLGLAMTFARIDGELGLCCPGGRMMRVGDEPFRWMAEEMQRADIAESERDAALARAELAASRAELATSRADAAMSQAELAVSRADVAEQRAAELEAELVELRKLRSNNGDSDTGA